MKETMEKQREEDRVERREVRRQMKELVETVRRMRHQSPAGSRHGKDQTDEEDVSVNHRHPRSCKERWRKLEIPIFEGTDAYGWLNRAERYFDLKEVDETERLRAAMVAMEGKALAWYQWWEVSSPNSTWEEFKTAILNHFQPSMIQSPFELLLSLKQTGTVEEYREQFELYAGPLKSVDPSYLKGIFFNGPKDVIKAELKLHPVERLSELIDYAQRVDEKKSLWNKGNGELMCVKFYRLLETQLSNIWEGRDPRLSNFLETQCNYY